MKTYVSLYAICVLVFIGCSKSETVKPIDDRPSIDADYMVLLSNNGNLAGSLLNANLETITLNPNDGLFNEMQQTSITYREGSTLSLYTKKPDCSGKIDIYDFKNNLSDSFDVFAEIIDCELEIKAIAHSDESLFVAYELPNVLSKQKEYNIRIINTGNVVSDPVDVSLDFEPQHMVFSGNRLFILSLDISDTGKNKMLVLNTDENEIIHEVDLGFNVQKALKNPEGNIVISYPDLHFILNSNSLATVSTVRYNDETAPKFGYAGINYFDTNGKLYYPLPKDSGNYPNIPAIYDFSSNTATLFLYERFLSEQQRLFEFEIGDTSMVSLDEANNVLLVGYKKSGIPNKGGLLRIKLGDVPEFLDNIDLDGVPYDIFIE